MHRLSLPSSVALLLLAFLVHADAPEVEKLEKQRCPKPKRSALVFSNGYAGDHLPVEDARYHELLGKLKQAGFNTVQGTYTEKRLHRCLRGRKTALRLRGQPQCLCGTGSSLEMRATAARQPVRPRGAGLASAGIQGRHGIVPAVTWRR